MRMALAGVRFARAKPVGYRHHHSQIHMGNTFFPSPPIASAERAVLRSGAGYPPGPGMEPRGGPHKRESGAAEVDRREEWRGSGLLRPVNLSTEPAVGGQAGALSQGISHQHCTGKTAWKSSTSQLPVRSRYL